MRAWVGHLALVAGVAYVLALGWAMQHLSYDVWGAMIIGPLIVAVSYPLVRKVLLPHDPRLVTIAMAGLLAKLAGSIVRYWVAFDAYGGLADAGRYHDYGRSLAAQIRAGDTSLLRVIPTGTGTQFIERWTATMYTVFGSSRLAGFMLFGWMAFWGSMLYLRAAMIAVPGISVGRYAALVMLAPSLVYWPSSIGKEAFLMPCLGLAAYGGARIFVGQRVWRATVLVAVGLGVAALVRPHMAGMWLAGVTAALIGGPFVKREHGKHRSRSATVVLLVIAAVALSFVAAFAIRYLDPGNEEASATSTRSAVDIFADVERRTEQGGSGFQTIKLNGPNSWPFAIVRTMTRPLPNEARSLAEVLPAVEMTSLMLAALLGWRRFANIPRMLRRSSYVLFALSLVMMFGLAFTSIGNLGILTRQRSLAMPLLLLPWCLPAWVPKRSRAEDAAPVALRTGVTVGR